MALGLALVAPSTVAAQPADRTVVIDYADEIRRVEVGDSLTYFLTGNVRAHRAGVYMRSDRATIFRASGIADFEDNVHLWDATTEIYADRVVYEEATDVARATGRVQMIDRESGSQVLADSMDYYRGDDLLIARPRPHGVLVPRDTTAQEDPFDLYADEMRFKSDSAGSRVVAVRDVLIERADLTAVADSLLYEDELGRVRLRLSPRVETAATYLTARAIDVELEENEIAALVAVGSARAVDKADSIPASVPAAFDGVSQTSFLEGDSLYIAFADEGIDWLVAEGRARSLNYTRESAPGEVETWSVNYLLGQRLRLNFRGDTLQEVLASGGHRGLYRTEEVRVGGPRTRPSEPIPWPDAAPPTGEIADPGADRGRREEEAPG